MVETHYLRLKGREIDLRAQDNQRKEEEGQERLDLDKMKALMNQENQEAKLEQEADLAGLRAGVSLLNNQWQTKARFTILVETFQKNRYKSN